MLYFFQLYLITCVLFLAGKDADSYLLKDRTDNALSSGRVKRWHRDGFILYILFLLPLIVWDGSDNWRTAIAVTLIRLSLFDLGFNHWAGLPESYLGGTAWSDRLFVRIFGINGAARKSLTFLAILIILNFLNHYL